MNLYSLLLNILEHPLNKKSKLKALKRFIAWQAGSYLVRCPMIYPFIEDSVLVVEKGMTGATGNIYNGLHEFAEMLFVLHFLRENDLFVDVGANIGSYTILASSNCRAKTIAFEPISTTFNSLKRNVKVNNLEDKVTLINKAVGAEIKILTFTNSLDAANHALPSQLEDVSELTSRVECTTLDSIVNGKPDLLKIDVEGLETEVLKGAISVLSSSNLKGVIIELNGSGRRYGYDEGEIHKNLLLYGFSPFVYDPFNRELKQIEGWGTHNTIYLRHLEVVRRRLKDAKRIRVNGQFI